MRGNQFIQEQCGKKCAKLIKLAQLVKFALLKASHSVSRINCDRNLIEKNNEKFHPLKMHKTRQAVIHESGAAGSTATAMAMPHRDRRTETRVAARGVARRSAATDWIDQGALGPRRPFRDSRGRGACTQRTQDTHAARGEAGRPAGARQGVTGPGRAGQGRPGDTHRQGPDCTRRAPHRPGESTSAGPKCPETATAEN